LLVDSLYAEAVEAAKSRATLSVSSPELIWILGEINSEARLRNRSQSVNLSTGYEGFLVLTRSSKWNKIGNVSSIMAVFSRCREVAEPSVVNGCCIVACFAVVA
jgi:hypothetical protein